MNSQSPYKFLDYYEFNKESPEPFFGRQSESQILLSDILVSRLVVLFAQTGTGKTSLINAGVRPLLEKRDYKHVLIRVRNDPAESARAELSDYLRVEKLEENTLPEQLEWAQQQVSRPLVLFFDQFEEFFLQVRTRDSKRRATQFVADIAVLYEQSDNGVHIVFSMREEWFVKMDLFREHIPELFQNESSLRLRFFQPQQAREAIVGPASLRGVEIDEKLIERVISDLANEDNEIEPAQLQIICDSLWRNKVQENAITLNDYRELGLKYAPSRKRPGATISQNVLTGRLVEAFEDLNAASSLNLLSRLLPQLSTDENTKSFRDLEGLAQTLQVEKVELQHLIDYLESSGLIRTLNRGDVTFIELAHDYLAHRQRLIDLQDRVKAIWPGKLLTGAMRAERLYLAALSENPVDLKALADRREASLSPENLQTISENVATADYDRTDLEFLFRWALARGVESYVGIWFEEARKQGIDVWQILREVINDLQAPEAAEKAVSLLGRVKDPQVWDLFASAIHREDLAATTIDVLSNLPVPDSAQLLQTALQGKYREEAIEALGRMRTPAALEILEEVLEKGESVQYTLGVLEKIAKRREDEVGLTARNIVEEWNRTTALSKSAVTNVGRRYYPAMSEGSYRRKLDDHDFESLVHNIANGRCVPILGAGIHSGTQPTASEIARTWAEQYEYPFEDSSNFPKVAQFLAVNYDHFFPKELIAKQSQLARYSERNDPTDAIAFMARLPLNVYITTNYDDLLEQGLKDSHKDPVVEYPRWNKYLAGDRRDHMPTVASPLVYHLHGLAGEPESLVLTEEDYLDHLTNLSRDSDILPIPIRSALSRSCLLFLGLSIESWTFEVLLSLLTPYLETSLARAHFCVQLPPSNDYWDQEATKIQRHFVAYFKAKNIKVHWGSVSEFNSELSERWRSRYES